jgi:hypothetical protein
MTLHKHGIEVALGSARVDWSRDRIQVRAELSLVDDLNDHERTKETVDHESIRYGDVPHVSITWSYGTARELRRGDGSGGAGIDGSVVEALPEPARTKVRRIVELADRWHLNTMRAGCAHQTVVYETGPYGRQQPSLERTKPCPVTGYRYGSAWLVEVPPEDVIAELRALFSTQCYSDHDEDIRTKGSCDYCGGTEPVES